MKINILDKDGFFVEDHVEGEMPPMWTADLVNNGFYKAQYQNYLMDVETGERWGGTWVETGGPSPEDIALAESIRVNAINEKRANLMSYASDMIGALSDEIEGMEDNDYNVPAKLRTDLKAWKQYRVAVKNIDVSLAPDIEWPVAPE
ncbi:putative phage tail fiber assembly protein [Yersinia rohdei]|uniref:tail fiber assembly protein n=1 Tax=Yersinia rohdei TaxID=29485 RepID=UPI00061C310F|nr:tail fiber assembly protein [Yersinia rohdei]CNE63691.1 putative phage tail fiber assembly protein [Yersinia rohdei]